MSLAIVAKATVTAFKLPSRPPLCALAWLAVKSINRSFGGKGLGRRQAPLPTLCGSGSLNPNTLRCLHTQRAGASANGEVYKGRHCQLRKLAELRDPLGGF
ncbi:hypothetical protein CHS0354_018231, partial [Potamilus streckersoni]